MKYTELKKEVDKIKAGKIGFIPVDNLDLMLKVLEVACVCHARALRYTLYIGIYALYCTVIKTSSGYFLKVQKDYING